MTKSNRRRGGTRHKRKGGSNAPATTAAAAPTAEGTKVEKTEAAQLQKDVRFRFKRAEAADSSDYQDIYAASEKQQNGTGSTFSTTEEAPTLFSACQTLVQGENPDDYDDKDTAASDSAVCVRNDTSGKTGFTQRSLYSSSRSNAPRARTVLLHSGGAEKAMKVLGDTRGSRRNCNDMVGKYGEYFTHIRDVLEQKAFNSQEEWEVFVTATSEEIANSAHLVLSDRKCSKVVEKIVGLLSSFLAAAPSAGTGGADSSTAWADSEQLMQHSRRSALLGAFMLLFRKIVGSAASLALHPNGSHVLQTVFLSLPSILQADKQLREEEKPAGAEGERNSDGLAGQSVEDLTLYCLNTLQSETGGWISLMRHSSGSHVFRALLRACAGIGGLPSVEDIGRRNSKKFRQKRDDSNIAAVSEVDKTASADSAILIRSVPLRAVLRSICMEVTRAIKEEPYVLLFDACASPAVQVLLAVADACDFTDEKRNLLAAIFPFAAERGGDEHHQRTEMLQRVDALVESAAGSRIVEVAVPLLEPDAFQRFFTFWLLKRVNSLAQGKFGNFVLQKLLAAPVLQAPHLQQIISNLNFEACMSQGTAAVLWRVSEACRRLQMGYCDFTKKLWNALSLFQKAAPAEKNSTAGGGASMRFVWLSVLMLVQPSSSQALFFNHMQLRQQAPDADAASAFSKSFLDGLDSQGKAPEQHEEAVVSSHRETDSEEKTGLEKGHLEKQGDGAKGLYHLSEFMSPTGYSLLMSLLRFPSAAVQPLVMGFKSFVDVLRHTNFFLKKWQGRNTPPLWEKVPLLFRLASDPQGSRLLEAIVRGGSTKGNRNQTFLPNDSVQRLLKAFFGFYAAAALHPTAAFVLTSFYDAASVNVKKKIVAELLPIADELKEKNYAVYKACEIYRYKQSEEAWTHLQEKRQKTRALFKEFFEDEFQGDSADKDSVKRAELVAETAACPSTFTSKEKFAVLVKDTSKKQFKKAKAADEKKTLVAEQQSNPDNIYMKKTHMQSTLGGGAKTHALELPREKKRKRKRSKTTACETQEEQQQDVAEKATSSGEDEEEALAGESEKNPDFSSSSKVKRREMVSIRKQLGLDAKRKDRKNASSAGDIPAEIDTSLDAALFFIEGTRDSLSKRKLFKRKKLEAETVAAAIAATS